MISYNWGHQAVAKMVKEGLEAAGFEVWFDLDKMAGSTLEASM
jgi:hypothetical protein